jgi:signal transduction histidine kinase
VVAHDLLNPLTTIEGWSESLPEEEPVNDGLARIQRAATRTRSLINGGTITATAGDRGGSRMTFTLPLA